MSAVKFVVRANPVKKIIAGKLSKVDTYAHSVETDFKVAVERAAALNKLAATGDKETKDYYYTVDSFEPARGC